jgi:hypothetical protein
MCCYTEIDMANTTFSGPVRSEGGFEVISINSSTGTVTTTATLGTATSVTTLSATGNVTADSGTAPVAGGAAAFLATSTAGFGIYFGSGAPTVAAAKGSLYLRTDGSGTGDRAYINTNGSTTWTALTTAA